MRILVVGSGSVGGYFGGRLAQSGRDITFLTRPKRAQMLRDNGLHIRSPHGDFSLKPNVITATEIDSYFDVIFVSVKAWSLSDAMEDFAPAVGEDSMILPVLNGMKHVDLLQARFGTHALIGSACKVGTMLDSAGTIVQIAPMQELTYGEMSGEVTARVQQLDETLQGCSFDAKLSSEIEREMWEKWALLATLGAATCLMRGNVGQIMAASYGEAFILNLFDEVLGAIRRVGSEPSEPFIAASKALLTRHGSPLASSMYRDLENGDRIEREQIIDDLIERAAAKGFQLPLLRLVSTNLGVYESKR